MDIRELHNEAMYKAELGDIARTQNLQNAIELYSEAYQLEKTAAFTALNEEMGQPTVSILLKSSAALAIQCGLNRDAEKLIGLALSGEPPMEIAEELRDMLETVNFNRHLDLKGITLNDDEVQLVIAGRGVGFGYAKSSDAFDRIEAYNKLTIRTIERKAGRAFRQAGKVPAELKNICQTFISEPKAASMAFRIKFGSMYDVQLSGFGTFEEVIDDINNNIELISKGDLNTVKENISDRAYFDNFLSLTKQLAPDGNDINLFGITSVTRGVERRVQLTSKREDISSLIKQESGSGLEEVSSSKKKIVDNRIVGVLSAADKMGKVWITSNDGEKTSIIVPEGLSDIVKTYWDEEVCITYQLVNKKKSLMDIDKI